MTTGEGIFYGLVFLGLIFLYLFTRDRWNWKRVWIWIGGIVVVPIFVGVVWIGYEKFAESQPKFQSELWGISVDAPKSEVIFLKGVPAFEDNGLLSFNDTTSRVVYYVLLSKTEKVRSVFAATSFEDKALLPNLQGIGGFSTLADLEAKFGKADSVSEHKDGLRRFYSFSKFGIVAAMERGYVIAIGFFDPKHGPIQFNNR